MIIISYTKVITAKIDKFILCIVDQYLFIFNSITNELNIHHLDNIDISNSLYCNLLPYQIINDNITFIIAIYEQNTKLNFHTYNFSTKNNKINKNNIFFNVSDVEKYHIDCQINSYLSYIICYYCFSNNKDTLLMTKFIIEDNNIIIHNTTNFGLSDYINVIKSALSFNNKFFICIILGEEKRLTCYINDFLLNNFEKINCKFTKDYMPQYKMYYF